MKVDDIINGSYGELWLDGEKLAEVKSFQAKVDFTKEDVDMAGKLGKYKKIVGYEGKGTMKLHKINSRLASKMATFFKTGKMPSFTVIGKLDDVNVNGAERVAIRDVIFDDLTLMDFESKKLLETECPFTFVDFEYLDMIN